MYGQFITVMENFTNMIVWEKQNVKHSLLCEEHTFTENAKITFLQTFLLPCMISNKRLVLRSCTNLVNNKKWPNVILYAGLLSIFE